MAITLLACGDDPAKPRVAASVAVTPDESVLCVSETVQLAATVRDADGKETPDAAVTWQSSQSNIATVDGTGLVSAKTGGHAVILASQGNISGTADVRVRSPELRFANDEPWVFVGHAISLFAEVVDLNDIVPSEAPSEWQSDSSDVATITSAGLVTGVRTGSSTITAKGACGVEAGVDVAVLDEPDGPELIYIKHVFRDTLPGMQQLRIVGMDGSGSRGITSSREYVSDFAWSHDGNRVVVSYASINGETRGGSFVIDANGRNEVALGRTLFSPQWSPDGSRIVFRHEIASGESDLYSIRPDGSDLRRLTDQPGDELVPKWSPGGQEILYLHTLGDSDPELWIVAADGSTRRQITLPTRAMNARWSPDGDRIAFDNGSGIWIVDADGTNARPFITNCTADGSCSEDHRYVFPAWSPDGQRIAYSHEQPFFTWSLVIAPASDANTPINEVQIPILCCAVAGPVPHWSPDGTHIAFDATLSSSPWPAIAIVDANGNGMRYVTGNVARGWRPGSR